MRAYSCTVLYRPVDTYRPVGTVRTVGARSFDLNHYIRGVRIYTSRVTALLQNTAHSRPVPPSIHLKSEEGVVLETNARPLFLLCRRGM